MVKVTLQYADYFPIMDNARNSKTRKRLFLAFKNKCKGNVPLFREMMILRDEAARLLGDANYAAYQLGDRLVTSPEKVNSFLDDLRCRLADRGAEELKRLKALKTADREGEPAGGEQYCLWDYRYYNRLLLEKDYQIDQQEIAEFFPLNKTLEGMLDIFSRLFGLVFYEVDASNQTKDLTWYPDVRIFHVWDDDDDGGEFVGYLYLDLYARDGKRGHPFNINLQPGFEYENGDRSYPSTVLLCSFAKPAGTKPCLLHHSDMVTLFHELGHGIHDLVRKTRYSRFHGTMTVLDFCETPSKMLENWCWLSRPLQSLSHHYETGEPIPQSMVDNLIRVKKVNSGLFYLRQLHISIFDLHIHQPPSHASILNTDITSTYNSLWQSITQMAGPSGETTATDTGGNDWGHGYATFFHLLSDYGAGYYSYLLADVYALDMFHSVFKSDPLNPEQGRRYRRMVLEKGGSQPEMKTLSDFLGREATTQAFYEELAIGGRSRIC
ncbi:saccharolysin, putative [Talaromyces marneffei ATCC 18224]|uniref:Saccharolysin, putative n=1 Tax=Talaromyces marneffei (strain ATCC 18224 / CBS 334.59 / QM 7333) TaxID=441960 RepID=B6QL72_TALMQ|nr:saccharolysin, putative [Talaromyces marneffei ATCC 18224]